MKALGILIMIFHDAKMAVYRFFAKLSKYTSKKKSVAAIVFLSFAPIIGHSQTRWNPFQLYIRCVLNFNGILMNRMIK